MRRKLLARLVLLAAGVAIWGYGQRADSPELRLAGIGVLAAALLLRFVPSRLIDPHDPDEGRGRRHD